MDKQGYKGNPQSHDLDGTRQGNQNQGSPSKGPQEGIDFFKDFHGYFLRERDLEVEEPLVEETDGATNSTPDTAMRTLR